MRKSLQLASLFLFAAVTALVADEPVPPHETFTIESAVLKETRRINVYMPPGYATAGDTRYPVLYMPDGGLQEDFPHLATTIDTAIRAGEMRPLILVGIENTERRRDMTGPTGVDSDKAIAPRVGGSAAFRRFIRDELFPAIEARYRTTPSRAIIGESLAGLFIVETLVVEPAMFDTYIAFDPSLWWNDGQLVKEAAGRLRRNNPGDITLYLAASSEPEISRLTLEFSEAFKQAEGKGFTLHYQPMPGEAHATIYHPAALLAFRALFPAVKKAQ